MTWGGGRASATPPERSRKLEGGGRRRSTGQVGRTFATEPVCRLTGATTKGSSPSSRALCCLRTACRKEGKAVAGIQHRLKEPKFRSDIQGETLRKPVEIFSHSAAWPSRSTFSDSFLLTPPRPPCSPW